MKIKKTNLILMVILVGLLASCTQKLERIVEETYTDGTPKLVRYFDNRQNIKNLVKEEHYFPSGKLRISGEYKDGNKDGHWISWYENGNKWSEGYYKNGINHGKITTWHENGQKYYEGYYKNGERAGTWKFWDEKGIFVKEVEYQPYSE